MTDALEKRKRLKQLYRELFDQLCALLYDLDPEGVGSKVDNPQLDEYAVEVNSIIPKLIRANSLDETREIVQEIFHYWFGSVSLINQNLDKVAKEIWEVYQRVWHKL